MFTSGVGGGGVFTHAAFHSQVAEFSPEEQLFSRNRSSIHTCSIFQRLTHPAFSAAAEAARPSPAACAARQQADEAVQDQLCE